MRWKERAIDTKPQRGRGRPRELTEKQELAIAAYVEFYRRLEGEGKLTAAFDWRKGFEKRVSAFVQGKIKKMPGPSIYSRAASRTGNTLGVEAVKKIYRRHEQKVGSMSGSQLLDLQRYTGGFASPPNTVK